jgi:hypothetical protein
MIAADRWHEAVIRDQCCGPSPLRVAGVILHRLAPDDDGLIITVAELAEAANVTTAVAFRALFRLRARGWISLPPMPICYRGEHRIVEITITEPVMPGRHFQEVRPGV